MKKCSMLYVTRETQINMPLRIATMKNMTKPCAGEGEEQQEFLLMVVGIQKGAVTLGDRELLTYSVHVTQ
jgi:hypothetical protein